MSDSKTADSVINNFIAADCVIFTYPVVFLEFKQAHFLKKYLCLNHKFPTFVITISFKFVVRGLL